MSTIQTIAQRFKSIGVDIPHPRVETGYLAEDLGIPIPCNHSNCPFAFDCTVCDQYYQVKNVTEVAALVGYLVSSRGRVREAAREKFEELMCIRNSVGRVPDS